MSHVKSIFFWLGGTVAPRFWQLTRTALERNDVRIDTDLCFALVDLERELSTGAINEAEYCSRVIERASAALNPEQLADAIENQIQLMPGILDILDALRPTYNLYLVSDYAHRWLTPVLQETGLGQYFPDEAILMTNTYTVNDLYGDLLKALTTTQVFDPDDCLLIDADPRRLAAALRARLKANVFIDTPRLRRDFGLWKMTLS